MKIILSHDVDHLYWSEHYLKDLYLIKSLFRNMKGLLSKQINIDLFIKRLNVTGRMHQLPELVAFHRNMNTNANFFFGMDNALGLSYNYTAAKQWIELLLNEGHEVGVHGIETRSKVKIQQEHFRFQKISGLEVFGIRTHYLRMSGYAHQYFSDCGYIYDSSLETISNTFKIDNLWEIPISIMDASLVSDAQLNQNLEEWKDASLKALENAESSSLKLFVINFHDLYFNHTLYPVIHDWYVWLVKYLKENGFTFTTFNQEVKNLNDRSLTD